MRTFRFAAAAEIKVLSTSAVTAVTDELYAQFERERLEPVAP
jgi:hypothetical protein